MAVYSYTLETASDNLASVGGEADIKIDDTHYIAFLSGETQVFEVNTEAGSISTAGDALEFDGVRGSENSCAKIDDTHYIDFCQGADFDGFVQTFEVNTSTWAVTTASTRLEFDTANNGDNSCVKVDSTHYVNFWGGTGNDGYAQIFEVNTSTWAVTTAGARLEFDTQNGEYNSCVQIDDTHYINFWEGGTEDGYVQVFEINTSTWAVTTAGARLEFDAEAGTFMYNACAQLNDTHYINFWANRPDLGEQANGFVQVFEVNTSTWAVTTAGSSLEFDTQQCSRNSCYALGANSCVNSWAGGDSSYGNRIQMFEIDTSTWEITTATSVLEYTTESGYVLDVLEMDSEYCVTMGGTDIGATLFKSSAENLGDPTVTCTIETAGDELEYVASGAVNAFNSCVQVDSTHYVNFWSGTDDDGYVQAFEVNTSTWAVTTAGARLEFDTQNGEYNSCTEIDDTHYINFWQGESGNSYVQAFEVNTSTWAVTTAGARLEFDASNASYFHSCAQLDDTHYVNFWSNAGTFMDPTVARVQVFEVDTSTWAVTTSGGILNFNTGSNEDNYYHSCVQIDTNHFINFWSWDTEAVYPDYVAGTQVFEVNTSTWAVTTVSSLLKLNTGSTWNSDHSAVKMDTNHFIDFWEKNGNGYAQVLEVNTSTWAVTTASTIKEVSEDCNYNSAGKLQDYYAYDFWQGTDSKGYARVFKMDTSTWEITTGSLTTFEADSCRYNSCTQVASGYAINYWDNGGSLKVQIFNPQIYNVSDITLLATATNIRSTRATISFTVNGVGDDIIEWGFFYDQDSSVTTDSTKRRVLSDYDVGTQYLGVTQLLPDTTYYFKAYARDKGGYSLSSETGSFTTLNNTKIQIVD